jgi:hypothetical protein
MGRHTVIDHRHLQTPVRDQGDRPTCVGFAVSAALEWMKRDSQIRSPEDAIWAAHREGGPQNLEETSVRLALSGLTRRRHAQESAWPYGTPPWPAPRPSAAKMSTNQTTLPLWRETPGSWDAIRDALGNGHAVVLTLRFVSSAWLPSGPDVDAPPGQKCPTNHAVLAVGLTETSDGLAESVIVKNSWGVGWGLAGYGLVSRRYLEHYVVRAHALED